MCWNRIRDGSGACKERCVTKAACLSNHSPLLFAKEAAEERYIHELKDEEDAFVSYLKLKGKALVLRILNAVVFPRVDVTYSDK